MSRCLAILALTAATAAPALAQTATTTYEIPASSRSIVGTTPQCRLRFDGAPARAGAYLTVILFNQPRMAGTIEAGRTDIAYSLHVTLFHAQGSTQGDFVVARHSGGRGNERLGVNTVVVPQGVPPQTMRVELRVSNCRPA